MVPGVNAIQLDVQNPNLRSKSLENLRKTKIFRDEFLETISYRKISYYTAHRRFQPTICPAFIRSVRCPGWILAGLEPADERGGPSSCDASALARWYGWRSKVLRKFLGSITLKI